MVELIQIADYQLSSLLRQELHEHIAVEKYLDNIKSISNGKIWIDKKSYWDSNREMCFRDNKEVFLTNKEKILLSLLFKNRSNTVSYISISYVLWGEDLGGNQDKIKTLIKRLRQKLSKNLIKNIPSFGYKIEI